MKALRLLPLVMILAALAPQPVLALEVGHHAHLGITNLPIDTVVIPRTPRTFHLVLQAHAQEGMTGAQVRVSDYSTVKPSIVNGVRRDGYHPLSVSALLAGPVAVDMVIPFNEWTCGHHELRFTIRLKPNFDGKEQFTTSRTYLWLEGCSTVRYDSGHAGWRGGGGGWYTVEEYAIGIQLSPFSAIRAGASTSWRVQSHANRGCLFRNPAAHAGSMGDPIGLCWSGTAAVSRTMPADLAPGERVMLYAEDTSPSRQHAGTYVVTVPEPGATEVSVDYQDWWRTDGLDVP